MQLDDLKAAREYFEKSLHLREQLARQDPDDAQARERPLGLLQHWAK